ncbi:MAG: DNA polymerase IV [Burkholderiaceae bacterium]
MSADRRIAHVDMDAFYASVELLRRPELVSRPVAIGGRGDPESRGVVTTANYPARVYGIRSGMPLAQAARLCPDCIFLPVDFTAYRAASRRFKAAIATITDRIEDRGIDEVYVDLDGLPTASEDVGRALKRAIGETTGLTCSVGIAPNKLLAKIASDLDKPDGLTCLTADELEQRIWPLPAGRINGIGPRARDRLRSLGIESIGDLAAADPVQLQRHFGLGYTRWLIEAAHGRDDRPLCYDQEPRSRSRETTFERDLVWGRHDDEIREFVGELSGQLARDQQSGHHAARTIGIKLRLADFTIVTRDLSLARATDDPLEIEQAALACLARIPFARLPSARLPFARVLGEGGRSASPTVGGESRPRTRTARAIRLIGVRASAIGPQAEPPPQLF